MADEILKTSTDSQPGFSDPEPIENQGPQEAKTGLSYSWEEVNAVTWKLTDGRGSNAWSGNRGGSYRTTRAVAWLMGIGNGLWVVRYRSKASRPMKLNAAKRYALEMLKGIRPGRLVTDPIGGLNRAQAALMPMWCEPVDRELLEYIREAETGWLLSSE